MNKFEFISHDSFPEDEYVKELVYLCFDGKYRVAYVRKVGKGGGLFWNPASVGLTRNGQKEYFPGFLQDSNFLEKDIKEFLEKRKWEQMAPSLSQFKNPDNYPKPQSMDEVASNEPVPF